MSEVQDEIDAVKSVYLDDVIAEGSGHDGSMWLEVRWAGFEIFALIDVLANLLSFSFF